MAHAMERRTSIIYRLMKPALSVTCLHAVRRLVIVHPPRRHVFPANPCHPTGSSVNWRVPWLIGKGERAGVEGQGIPSFATFQALPTLARSHIR
jgi:hypothetical protein